MPFEIDSIDQEKTEHNLQVELANSSKFLFTHTIYNGAVWQVLQILEGDSPALYENEMFYHNWGFIMIHERKWLFMHIGWEGQSREWTIGFDCNLPATVMFLTELLKTKRVQVCFPNGICQRLDPNPADSLVEDHGKILEKALPVMRKRIRMFEKKKEP